MGLVDKHIKKIIELSAEIPGDDIFNIYQLKGALPERKCKDDLGNITLTSYTQKDMFVVFGIEEGENDNESVVVTDANGAPKDKIIITNIFEVKILFHGEDSDFYALKFKARLWSRIVQSYLDDSNISVKTQNPKISFETEEVAGEFWDKRGVTFDIIIELHFDDPSEDFEKLGKITSHRI